MKFQFLAFLLGALAAPHADAAQAISAFESEPARQGVSEPPVRLAQAYDFDVYIDQYGREVVVDPRTGEVVEIRPPVLQLPPPPVARRQEPRDYYDPASPDDVDRFYREREAAIDRGWDRYPEREYYEDNPGRDDGYQGGYDEVLPPEEDRYEVFPPPIEDRTVRRAPLDAPGERESELASVPPEETDPSLDTPDTGFRELGPDDAEVSVPGARGSREKVAAFQVLLDRVSASPGVIDGRIGDNVNKAIDAYHRITGSRLKTYDKEWVEEELEKTGGPAFTQYTITSADAAGPYVASIPSDYGEKARLSRLGFTRVTEMLAERFHMDEAFLKALNPNANFDRPGTIIRVVNPGSAKEAQVSRIVADKSRKQLRVYDDQGKLVAAYPATIGSASTPSPSGTHEVERIAFDPEYTYDPKKNFKQGNNDRILTIPPGPNGPVGSIWIALSKPTYGIHGTPEPSKIGKTSSHGCIRLTNWDAQELAKSVQPGVKVEFIE